MTGLAHDIRRPTTRRGARGKARSTAEATATRPTETNFPATEARISALPSNGLIEAAAPRDDLSSGRTEWG